LFRINFYLVPVLYSLTASISGTHTNIVGKGIAGTYRIETVVNRDKKNKKGLTYYDNLLI
jgi:hypothetical protein